MVWLEVEGHHIVKSGDQGQGQGTWMHLAYLNHSSTCAYDKSFIIKKVSKSSHSSS